VRDWVKTIKNIEWKKVLSEGPQRGQWAKTKCCALPSSRSRFIFVFWPQTTFLVNRLSARRQRFVFVLRGKASLPSCRTGTHKKAEHRCNTICGQKGLFSFLNFLFLSFLTNEKSFKQLADSTRWGVGH